MTTKRFPNPTAIDRSFGAARKVTYKPSEVPLPTFIQHPKYGRVHRSHWKYVQAREDTVKLGEMLRAKDMERMVNEFEDMGCESGEEKMKWAGESECVER